MPFACSFRSSPVVAGCWLYGESITLADVESLKRVGVPASIAHPCPGRPASRAVGVPASQYTRSGPTPTMGTPGRSRMRSVADQGTISADTRRELVAVAPLAFLVLVAEIVELKELREYKSQGTKARSLLAIDIAVLCMAFMATVFLAWSHIDTQGRVLICATGLASLGIRICILNALNDQKSNK